MADKSKTRKIVWLVAVILGALALVMLFLPAVTAKMSAFGQSKTESDSGIALAFGNGDGYKFNFVDFLALVLVIVGIVGSALALRGVKVGGFLAMGGYLVAGILYFLFLKTYKLGLESKTWEAVKLAVDLGAAKLSLGIGAILGGIFNILAAAAAGVATFVMKD